MPDTWFSTAKAPESGGRHPRTAADLDRQHRRRVWWYRRRLDMACWPAVVAPVAFVALLWPEVAALAAGVLALIEVARYHLRRRAGRDALTPVDMVRGYLLAAGWARRFGYAVIDAGAADRPVNRSMEKVPVGGARVVRRTVRATAAGVRFQIRGDVDAVIERDRKVARHLDLPFRVTPHPAHPASRATIEVRLRSPLEEMGSVPWPWLDRDTISAWDPVPIGVDADGEPAVFSLAEGSLLVGGRRRKGKSVFLHLLCAVGVLAPDARLWILDGKENELLPFWRTVADGWAGSDPQDAIRMLERLRGEMRARYRLMAEHDPPRRKLHPDDGLPIDVLVVDELAYYTRHQDRKAAEQVTGLLREIVSLGGAAGIPPIVATQKPSERLVPTELRDQFGAALAFSSKNRHASDTILGDGAAANGHDASTFQTPGVAIYDDDGDRGPRRVRVCHLTDDDIARIVERADVSHRAAPAIAELERMLAEQSAPPAPAPAASPPPPAAGDTRSTDQIVLDLVRAHPGEYSRSRINLILRDEYGRPDGGAAVGRLRDAGRIRRTGEKRGTRYHPADDAPGPGTPGSAGGANA